MWSITNPSFIITRHRDIFMKWSVIESLLININRLDLCHILLQKGSWSVKKRTTSSYTNMSPVLITIISLSELTVASNSKVRWLKAYINEERWPLSEASVYWAIVGRVSWSSVEDVGLLLSSSISLWSRQALLAGSELKDKSEPWAIINKVNAVREHEAKGIRDVARRESNNTRIIFIYSRTFITILTLFRTYASRWTLNFVSGFSLKSLKSLFISTSRHG